MLDPGNTGGDLRHCYLVFGFMGGARPGYFSGLFHRYGRLFAFFYIAAIKLGVNLMSVRTFTAVIHKDDDLFVATCPEIGTVSQGYTMEEAVDNLKEATELYLDEFPPSTIGRSFLTTFEATYA
jgi:hypothetical protein